MTSPTLSEFYHGKTILLTGSTGFLGKVILEKILRSLASVQTVYLSITPRADQGKQSEFLRFQQEILASQIWDRLKIQIGFKKFKELFDQKIKLLPLDLRKDNLGLSAQMRTTLTQDLNVIINCAASLDFDAPLDTATRINVTGPLLLMKLAEESPCFEAFLQLSTAFVNADKTGYIEERLYDTNVSWQAQYQKIITMSKRNLTQNAPQIMSPFPNSYNYSKRMCENLLVDLNARGKNFPLILLRPSIVGVAVEEPMPGWTDTTGLLQGVSLMVGLGILKDIPGRGELLGDIVPVDIVARQALLAVAYQVAQFRAGGPTVLVSHATSTSVNPITYKSFFEHLTRYQNANPYENRAGKACLTMHAEEKNYALAYKYKSQLPTKALYYLTRVFASKTTKTQVSQLNDQVNELPRVAKLLGWYILQEWIFDSTTQSKLNKFLNDPTERAAFNVDLSRLHWSSYAMNMGYGLKKYILNEEAALPSLGYGDVVQRMAQNTLLVPWAAIKGKNLDVRTPEAMKKLILSKESVQRAIADLVKEKVDYYRGTLHLDTSEDKLYQEVEKQAVNNINTIISIYDHKVLTGMALGMKQMFQNLYDMIIVNEDTLSKIKAMCANRKGPIIFCPTHRSYVDFMILSVVLFFYNMEVPHICAGEDFLGIAGVVHLLRASGAFFMRRTFRGDPLYKAVFHEYVTQLCTDKMCLEFFVEGTRSRTNKMLPAKFGFLSIINNCYFDRKIEEATFVPVTLNYTKVFEDESFPNELRGEQKVKESLGRIIKAVEVFKMNFGTIYLDFFEPINLSEVVAQQKQINSAFDPFTNKADRTKVNQVLGNQLVFTLQDGMRMMPPNLVATVMLLYRKGISADQLAKKVAWLGMNLYQRGAKVTDEQSLPGPNSVKLGLKHLSKNIDMKRGFYYPKVEGQDFNSYVMLAYYRNPVNFHFFNEALIVCSLYSFGIEQAWKGGVDVRDLRERTMFLANLLKREEVLKDNIVDVFEQLLQFMCNQKVISIEENIVTFKGEAASLLIGSFVWPYIDTYYSSFVYALSMVKNRDIPEAALVKDVQWLAETLYVQNKIQFFESCVQPIIANAKGALIELGVFEKTNVYVNLGKKFQGVEGEKALVNLIAKVGQFRMSPAAQALVDDSQAEGTDLRRTIFQGFPIMAKL